MALTSTIGTFYMPFRDRYNAKSPHYVEVLQTCVSGSTQGAYKIVGTQTANTTYLYNIHVDVTDATNTAQILVMYGTHTLGSLPIVPVASSVTSPSAVIGTHSYNFSPFGLMGPVQGGADATSTVSLNIVGATATVNVTCMIGVEV